MDATASAPSGAPLLSVVVPFHNVVAYLDQCLSSIRDQLLSDIEVVLVDDGSDDGSSDIARRFVASDPRFRLISQPNAGIGPARTRGGESAIGEFLAFVDGDDLVAPRAYTAMVTSLQETGSQIAAGNAMRFSSTRTPYQSWTHAEPFERTIPRTTLQEHPSLIRDRMVWNKVYRRDFWQSHGYVFPAMRYEDFPIVLTAYLDAESIDVLSDHVYFWRDRESGDSITQRTLEIDNAQDRYRSAIMILDALRHRGVSDDVQTPIVAYLAHVDVVALAQVMVSVSPADRAQAEFMAVDLAQRLHPIAGSGTRIAQLIHRALREEDLERAGALARWRSSGNHGALVRYLLTHPDVPTATGAAGAILDARRPQNPFAPRRLRTSLTEARWDKTTLKLKLSVTLRSRLARHATVSASFSGHREKPLQVHSSVTPGGLRIALEMTLADATAWPTESLLMIELRAKGFRWRGPVTFEADRLPEPVAVDSEWFQLGGSQSSLALRHLKIPPILASVSADGGYFQLKLSHADGISELDVERPKPSVTLTLPVIEGAATVEASALIHGDPPDDVVTGVAERPIRPTAGLANSVSREILLHGTDAAVAVNGREVKLTRGSDGGLVVRQSPIR